MRDRVHPSVLAGFGSAAGAYERARPEYPRAAVDWLCSRLGIVPGATVVDLAAGTGKLTRALLPSGARVVAVEPVPQMRALIGTEAVEGYAESMPLPDAFADVVTIGQAFHWFATDEALAEIARVLRPGGRLGLVWNGRDQRSELQRRVTGIIEELRGDEATSYRTEAWRVVEASPLFGPVETASFEWSRALDADGLVELVSSVSFVAIAPPGARAAALERVRALAPAGTFEFPYLTEAYAAERLP